MGKDYHREYQKKWRKGEAYKEYTSSSSYKEKHRESTKRWRENNKEYYQEYKKKHREKNREKNKIYETERYNKVHRKTTRFIKKYNLRPNECSICGKEWKIIAHHIDYSKWYEVVFCCLSCHRFIHLWNIECSPVNLIELSWTTSWVRG